MAELLAHRAAGRRLLWPRPCPQSTFLSPNDLSAVTHLIEGADPTRNIYLSVGSLTELIKKAANEAIPDAAQVRMRAGGYSNFSFCDPATDVGLKGGLSLGVGE
ncbi:hypothetical protein [Roseovarius mucosus]|uniref:hypothetical protein n=1 Tax=Roseovarius mucosus TaxID=215743 RepID=UPI001C2F5A62|nr:hypothetical protein [Roseovarius mucosus]